MSEEATWKMRAIRSAEKAAERTRRIYELEQQLAEARALLEEIEHRIDFAIENWPDMPLSSFLPHTDEWIANIRAFLQKNGG